MQLINRWCQDNWPNVGGPEGGLWVPQRGVTHHPVHPHLHPRQQLLKVITQRLLWGGVWRSHGQVRGQKVVDTGNKEAEHVQANFHSVLLEQRATAGLQTLICKKQQQQGMQKNGQLTSGCSTENIDSWPTDSHSKSQLHVYSPTKSQIPFPLLCTYREQSSTSAD